MITEDYLSFETAKLLKEKGFDELCHGYFRKDNPNDLVELAQAANWNDEPFFTSRPTPQMVMKWLREVHNLHIEVYRTACGYLYIISRVPTGSDLYSDGDDYDGDDENSGQWTTYEKACEAAIKYCLENLI